MADVDRISIRCREGDHSLEVQAFTRSSEQELLARLAEDPESPSGDRVARTKAKAGRWLVDVKAARLGETLPGPRRRARGLPADRRPLKNGKASMTCPKCPNDKLHNPISVEKLQPVLDHIWATRGESAVTIAEVRAVLKVVRTQGRP